MGRNELPKDFKDFLRLLNSTGVEYMVVGGYAVGYYGYVRFTADIEILTSISGVDFKDAYQRRLVADIEGIPVNLIGLEDLKANKRASGRLKDLADLEKLVQLPKK